MSRGADWAFVNHCVHPHCPPPACRPSLPLSSLSSDSVFTADRLCPRRPPSPLCTFAAGADYPRTFIAGANCRCTFSAGANCPRFRCQRKPSLQLPPMSPARHAVTSPQCNISARNSQHRGGRRWRTRSADDERHRRWAVKMKATGLRSCQWHLEGRGEAGR